MNLNFLRGPGNVSLDIMRLGGASAFILYPLPYLLNAFRHGVVPDASYGTGYALVIGAVGAGIFAKDVGVSKANSTASGTS
jgi:hypothetical protein